MRVKNRMSKKSLMLNRRLDCYAKVGERRSSSDQNIGRSEKGRDLRRLLTFTLVLFLVASRQTSPVLGDEGSPAYSITISMNERQIYGPQRVEVALSVVGFGTISNGSLAIQSDTSNILANTLRYRYCVFTWVVDGGQRASCSQEIV